MNKPGKPAVYTSDKMKADLAEAKVITLSIKGKRQNVAGACVKVLLRLS